MRSLINLAVSCAALLTTTTVMADTTPSSATTEVFFAFDSASLAVDTSSQLAAIITWSQHHPNAKIVLDGHADSVGAASYNIGLSSRRTDSVQTRLVALGVPADRIFRGIYGENDIRRTTAAGDRRVTLWTTEEPLHNLIDQSLLRGAAIVWNLPVTEAEMDGHVVAKVVARR